MQLGCNGGWSLFNLVIELFQAAANLSQHVELRVFRLRKQSSSEANPHPESVGRLQDDRPTGRVPAGIRQLHPGLGLARGFSDHHQGPGRARLGRRLDPRRIAQGNPR